MRYLLTILLFAFASAGCLASSTDDSVSTVSNVRRHWYSPDYIPIQYAGNIGWLSAGVGYTTRRDHYQLSLVYGYSPKSIAGARIHTITAKNIFHLYRYQVNKYYTVLPYAALGISAELGGRSFFIQPEHMPDKYYRFPKSVHAVPAVGFKVRQMTTRLKGFHGIEFFAEATTVDAYIWYKFLSKDVRMSDIISAAVGIQLMRK